MLIEHAQCKTFEGNTALNCLFQCHVCMHTTNSYTVTDLCFTSNTTMWLISTILKMGESVANHIQQYSKITSFNFEGISLVLRDGYI